MVPDDLLDEVYRYWCGHVPTLDHYPVEQADKWFRADPATDEEIRTLFGPFLDDVAGHDFDAPALSREAAVGLVIMLDQFPRNLFRGDARAFAYDAVARRHALSLVEAGLAHFALIEQVFIALPFEHSEAIEDQDLSVKLFEALLAAAPELQKAPYEEFLIYAGKHRDLIRRFGRFPHRNAALGRESTPEELAFLAEHGRGF